MEDVPGDVHELEAQVGPHPPVEQGQHRPAGQAAAVHVREQDAASGRPQGGHGPRPGPHDQGDRGPGCLQVPQQYR